MKTLTVMKTLLLLVTRIKEETSGQIVNHAAELHSTVDLPCIWNICPERTVAVQWYRSSNPDDFIKDGKALAWWYRGEFGNALGFQLKEDFSMTMRNVNFTDIGLYRCLVTSASGDLSPYDVKLDIYANPYSLPVIGYIPQIGGFNVSCSVTHVFPEIFPEFMSYEGHRTSELNGDGTYNATVSHLFPPSEKDTTVACHYVNFNFTSMSSLLLPDSVDQPVDEDQVAKNVSCPDLCKRCTPMGVWMVWIILILEVCILIIMLLNYIECDQLKHCHVHETSTPDMKNEGTVSSCKPFLKHVKVIMPTIQVVTIIFLVAYLAVAHR